MGLVNDIRAVRHARVLFLHHSVGQNMLEAIAKLDAAVDGAPLPIVGLPAAEREAGGVLAHVSGGENARPTTKIDAFAAALVEHPGLRAQIAMMKLCFVDFTPETDVDALLHAYARRVGELRRLRPALRVVHVTTPLTARPRGPVASARRLLGLSVWEDQANARRDRFNRALRVRFAGEPVFDLAAIEASGPSGDRDHATVDGARVPTLDPLYTDDGGHLNATGARVVAAAWFRLVADVVRAR